MGSYDGAELCELIGIFAQSVLQNMINKEAMDLYRDDELIVLNKVGSQKNRIKLERKSFKSLRTMVSVLTSWRLILDVN